MQKNKGLFIVTAFIIVGCLFSCDRNKYVLPKNKMEAVLYDLYMAQGVVQLKQRDFSSEEKKEAVFNEILEKHNISRAVLDSSLIWYSDHMDVYVRINDSVISRLKKEQSVYGNQLQEQIMREERIRRRLFPSYFYLTPEQPYFTFQLDSVKLKNTVAVHSTGISYNVLGISPDVKLEREVIFTYEDTTIVDRKIVTADTDTIVMPLIDGEASKNISGYVYAGSAIPRFRVLLHDIKLNSDTVIPAGVVPGIDRSMEKIQVQEMRKPERSALKELTVKEGE